MVVVSMGDMPNDVKDSFGVYGWGAFKEPLKEYDALLLKERLKKQRQADRKKKGQKKKTKR